MSPVVAVRPVEIRGTGLTYRVRGRADPIIDDIQFEALPGRVTGLLGPNGSGKSTLLHTLAGALDPTSGEVWLDGRSLADFSRRERARTIAVMEQTSDTDTDLTVADIVALGRLPHRGRFSPEGHHDLALCDHALRSVGMDGTQGRRWRTLSGGERQRVQAARALAQSPAVLLLDEPTNHLDIRHQHELLTLLASSGMTVVTVLHDPALAARYSDALTILHRGRLHSSGPTADVLTVDTLRTVFGVRARVDRHGDDVSVEVVGAATRTGCSSSSPDRERATRGGTRSTTTAVPRPVS